MQLNKISLKDQELFEKFLKLRRRELCAYSFLNIFIWKKIFDIKWAIVENSLCVFFQDKIGCFLYLPPLGQVMNPEVVEEAFAIMDGINHNREISRIENIEEKDLEDFKKPGFAFRHKYPDYLCQQAEQAQLSGERFKSKRSCVNFFIKHYAAVYLPFAIEDAGPCLNLYQAWKKSRGEKNQDPLYQGMLEDSYSCLEVLMENYTDLKITGRVVKINQEIKAFTFGCTLSADTFCVLYEITDLSIKGLAQYIFHQFCRELNSFKYINIMDDSGLENLKKVKISYHPERIIPAYIIQRA